MNKDITKTVSQDFYSNQIRSFREKQVKHNTGSGLSATSVEDPSETK